MAAELAEYLPDMIFAEVVSALRALVNFPTDTVVLFRQDTRGDSKTVSYDVLIQRNIGEVWCQCYVESAVKT